MEKYINDLEDVLGEVKQIKKMYASRVLLEFVAKLKYDMTYHEILTLVEEVRKEFCDDSPEDC